MLHPRIATLAAALLAGAACRPAPSRPGGAAADSVAIRRDVAFLAADSLGGRFTGTGGARSAARYIARRLEALRLAPLFCDSSAAAPCAPSYISAFESGAVAAAHAGLTSRVVVENVGGLIRGTDPALRGEYLVIGAHYDHLGTSGFGILDPDSAKSVHNGADDNASGTSAVIELARLLKRHPPRRSVAVVLFGGEELGLLGSQRVVSAPPVPLARIVAMLNFDMVGRLRGERLIVYGVATAAELPAIVEAANVEPRFTLHATGDGFGSSDHAAFYAKGIPALHFFTDLHGDYHRATDDLERIDAAGIARVVSFAERVARAIADRDQPLTAKPPPPRAAGAAAAPASRRSNVSLGSIPDMGATDVRGVRLSGVVPGSAAEHAGLRAGDVIVEFDGKPVKDLYEYSDALYARQPGDVVRIVIERGGERLTLSATLGRRGG